MEGARSDRGGSTMVVAVGGQGRVSSLRFCECSEIAVAGKDQTASRRRFAPVLTGATDLVTGLVSEARGETKRRLATGLRGPTRESSLEAASEGALRDASPARAFAHRPLFRLPDCLESGIAAQGRRPAPSRSDLALNGDPGLDILGRGEGNLQNHPFFTFLRLRFPS